jgi:myo-inositol-1(or 4)-monophosphatase
VTEADFAAQQVIHDLIHRRFPHHGFLGEEGLDTGSAEFRWIIDPLDGTTNYVHGFPYFAVSIGLEKAGKLIAGAIYDPSHDEFFAASEGGGATLNKRTIRCSKVPELSQAMLVASLPVAVDPSDIGIRRFLALIPVAQTVQRTGSAALNLAYLAAGRIDGFWSASLKPWDMAAGVLIVREAGGVVTKISGQPFVLDEPDLLASNGAHLQSLLVAALPQATSIPGGAIR